MRRLTPAVGRARTCPACDHTIRERSARWCGSCGAPLGALTTEPPGPPTSPWRRRALVTVAAALVAAPVASVGAGIVDRPGTRSTAVRDTVVATPDADTLDALEPLEPAPRPLGLDAPNCTGSAQFSCFRWTARADGAGFRAVAVGAGSVVTVDAAGLTARDLRSGSTRWTAPGDGRGGDGSLVVAGDLILHRTDGDLVGRALGSGEQRWRNAALGGFRADEVHRHDDIVAASGHHETTTGTAGIERGKLVGGIDAATGALLWHASGRSAGLAAEGISVLLTAGGELRAYEATGDLRWEIPVPLDGVDSGVWAEGHLVGVYGSWQTPQAYRLLDGEPLTFVGEALTSDADHTLVAEFRDRDGAGLQASGDVVLLGAEGEVWRADDVVDGWCYRGARLRGTTVEIRDCRGVRIVLDRSDGTERSRVAATDADSPRTDGGTRVGPYELRYDATGELLVRDTDHDVEVARMPTGTWPVGARTEGDSSHDLGGVALLQGRGWLTALDLPSESGPNAGDTGVHAQ